MQRKQSVRLLDTHAIPHVLLCFGILIEFLFRFLALLQQWCRVVGLVTDIISTKGSGVHVST